MIKIYEDQFPIWKEKPSRQAFGDPDPETGLYSYIHSGKVDYWVDILIDTTPAWSKLPWRRWFCEVHVRVSSFPGNQPEHIWFHYFEHDYHARSFHHAVRKSEVVASDLADLMDEDPDERPVDQPFENHSHPDLS